MSMQIQTPKQREMEKGIGNLLARSNGFSPAGYGSAGDHGVFCLRSILRSISRNAGLSGCMGGSCSSCVVEDIPDSRDRPLPTHKPMIHYTATEGKLCGVKNPPQACLQVPFLNSPTSNVPKIKDMSARHHRSWHNLPLPCLHSKRRSGLSWAELSTWRQDSISRAQGGGRGT